MAVKIFPKYSNDIEFLKLDLKDDELVMTIFDTRYDEAAEANFNKEYFKKHFKIVSEFGNFVEIQPTSYSEVSSTLTMYYEEYEDKLKCSYGPFDFELENEKTKDIMKVLLD